MTAVLIALNILAGLFLIGVVLLQSGKGADMGAAFGGASSTVFGPSGAGNVLTKVTAATAALFMGTSLMLAVLSSSEQSVFDDVADPTAEVPAVPTPAQPLGNEDGPVAGGVNPNAAAEARGEEPPAPLEDEAAGTADQGASGADAVDAPAGEAVEAPAGAAVEAPAGAAVEAPAGEAPAGDASSAPAAGGEAPAEEPAGAPAGEAAPAPGGTN